jgi:hypothetical protein
MDCKFERKATASTTETTTLRKILLTEGKAFTITESVDVAVGRWIVGIPSDKVDLFTQLLAGSIAKCYENGQIPPNAFLSIDQPAPSLEDKRHTRRNSGTSAISTDEIFNSFYALQSVGLNARGILWIGVEETRSHQEH